MDSDPSDTKHNEDNLEEGIKPIFLLLLDGFGVAPVSDINAISLAKKSNISKIFKEYPVAVLESAKGTLNNRYLSLGSGTKTLEDDQFIYSDLSAVLSTSGIKQLKIFDSERLAALSYFFNGRREEKVLNEDWITVSSAGKNKAFDIELSCKKIFQEAIKSVKEGDYNFTVASCSLLDYFASNNDILETAKAFEIIDKNIKKLSSEIIDKNGILIISSVHGNAEKMSNLATDTADREMTNNPVPLVIVGGDFEGRSIGFKDAPEGDLSLLEPVGSIANLAPTIIDLFSLDRKYKDYFSEKSLLENL